jgi:hypothetical protein
LLRRPFCFGRFAVQKTKSKRDPRRIVLICFAVGSSFVLGGNRPNCDNRPPTLTCDVVAVTLDPGTCVEIQNPCDNHQWSRLDALRLCDEPAGIFVETQRTPRARFLCAAADVGTLVDEPVDFFYARPAETGVGTFRVTVGVTALSASATANPTVIPYGGNSQLDALASGGSPPYTYQWSPGGGLSQNDIANPVASPQNSTQFTVVVTDSVGAQAGASVIVNVGVSATAQANPATISVGQSSTLSVNVNGGTAPYSYTWNADPSLSTTNGPSPVASPIHTTSYTVTVTDFFGATAVAAVTVNVSLEANASANPETINIGGQSQLDVAVQGGTPPYSYSWGPAASLDASTVHNPVANPSQSTTYTVVVTDAAGSQASSQVNVSVLASSLTACFSLTPIGSFAVQGDATCSTGNIVEYRWWIDYAPGVPPYEVGTSPISGILEFEHPGENLVRLEVIDSNGGSASATQIVVVQ